MPINNGEPKQQEDVVSWLKQMSAQGGQGPNIPDERYLASLLSCLEPQKVGLNEGDMYINDDGFERYNPTLDYAVTNPEFRPHNGNDWIKDLYPKGPCEGVYAVWLKTRPVNFVPPRDLMNEEDPTNRKSSVYWKKLASRLFQAVFQNLHKTPFLERLNQEKGAAIQNVFSTYECKETKRMQSSMYVLVDIFSTDQSGAEVASDVDLLIRKAKQELKAQIIAVMSDSEQLAKMVKAIDFEAGFNNITLFTEATQRIDQIRESVEDPNEKMHYLKMCMKIVQKMGFHDVAIEQLTTEDWVKRGCMGLYTPAKQGEYAKISIPMSYYGTAKILNFEEVIYILAHELTHHKLAQLAQVQELPSHGTTFEALNNGLLEKMKKIRVDARRNEKGEFKLIVKLDKSGEMDVEMLKEAISGTIQSALYGAKLKIELDEAHIEAVARGLSYGR